MEIWKPVPGFEGRYEVSSAGRVRSLDRVSVGRDGVAKRMQGVMLSTRPNTGGYPCVRLGRESPVMVHQLVAAAFIGPRPEGLYVCHRDGNRCNNRPSNLRYDTPKANQQDRIAHGTLNRGNDLPQAKLNIEQVRSIKSLLGSVTHRVLAERFGVSKAAIYRIASGKNWKYVN